MPKYKVNGRTFNIPDNEVDLFEADFPEAQLHYQTNDGRKFTIYANERKDFLSDFPDATELGWSETIKEQAKQADPFQPEDNLAQPMYGSMSYQDNIGKPEDSLYYPSPLSEEGRADYEPITAEERSKQEYDMLMRQLDEFNATNGNMMDTYEAYEKAAKHQVNEGGFAIDTPERRYLDEMSSDYHARKMERDELNERIKNNAYFNQMRMAEADAANETVDAISNLMAQNEAENTELHKKMQAMNALAMNPRGSFSGFTKTKEMQEYMDERADLETAKRLYQNTAQVYAAPINDGEDIFKKFGQGFGQRVDDADFWSMGIIGIADDMNARAAFQKIQDKFGSVKEFANLTDAEIDALLTPSEQLLISAVMDNNAALYARKDNTAGAYEAGAGAADSLMFMAQFLLTGGIGDAATVGTAAHRRLVNWLGRKVGSMSNGLMKDVGRGAVKLGVGTAESIGKALVMTPLMPHTYANIADKMMSFDDNGELMDTTDAIISGSIDALIETWSESTGDFVNKILGVPGDITKGVAKKVLKNVDFSDWGKAMNAPMMKILKKGGFNGFLGEMGEEFIGNATRSLVGTLAPGSGQDPEALKNFAKWEQLLVTAGSFAPMTIFGIGTSSAQYGLAKRKLANAQSAFESMLREASYTEDQTKFIVDELLGSTDANLTPEKLVANFSPLLRELAFNDKFANNRTQAMQSAVDFMWQIARYRTFDGVYHRQEEQQRNDMLAEIQEGTGREFWTTRLSENAGLDGTAYETDEVRAVEFNDGRVAYVLGGDGVNNTVVYNDGQTGFLSEEQLNEGKANGSIVSDATMGLNDYLTQQVARVRMTEEEQRMFAERNTNIGQVRAQFPIDATVELGTTEAPIQGIVHQQTPNGVIVESPVGVSQLSWEELGHTIGIEVNPQTDAQMEEEAINNLEIADLQRRRAREQRRTQRNAAAEAVLTEEQMVDEAENEGLEKPIPMKADGTVDQTAFWNESPARWAQWKTEQRQDGGAYASTYIQNAIGILEGQIAESEAAFLAESDFDAKDALEQTINQQRARLAELQDLAMQYMPSVIPAETSAEASAEQTQPGVETSKPAAVMADRQKFELDAEYQRRLSLAKTLAEKEMILKEYFEAISAGSMEAVVMNKQNYKQIMKEKGCSEQDIEQVADAIKLAEELHQAVDALYSNDKVFVVAEYNSSIEQGRLSYVHERQHGISKRRPELIQRILSLGLSRETLQKIVKTLSGSEFYSKKTDDVLADEILSFTMEIGYTFDDFSVTLSKLGLPIELINVLNEINDEQRKDFTLVNARRNANALDTGSGIGGQDDSNQGEVSRGVLGEEGDGSSEDSERGTEAGESGESTTRGAEASEEGLQVPVAEVEEESEEEPKGPDFRITGEEPEDIEDITEPDGTVRFSVRTYHDWTDNLGHHHKGTRAMVIEKMEEMKFSKRDIKKMVAKMDTAYEYMEKLRTLTDDQGRVRFEEFNEWAKATPLYKQVGRDYVKAITSLVSNGDYPINLELTTDCIKREAFTHLLNALVKRGAQLSGMGPAQIITMQKVMKQYGIEVACQLCFVEGKRLQIVNWASQIVEDWNDALEQAGVETDEYFEFGKDGDAFIPSEEWRTYEDKPKLLRALKAIDDAALLFQGIDPETFNAQRKANQEAVAQYIKEKSEAWAKKNNKPASEWKPNDVQKAEIKKLTHQGLAPSYVNENLLEYRDAFNRMRNEWLEKHPNADPLSFSPTKKQWEALDKIRNRQIDNVKAKMVRLIMEHPEMRKKMTINDLLGSKGLMEIRQQHGQPYADLYSIILQRFGTGTPKPVQDAVPYDGEVLTLTESAFKKANEIGGARLFSFSDFDITKVFDYMQMFFDLEAKRQKLQSYTKEVAAVLIFGRSNAKFNISTLANAFVPAEVQEEYKKATEKKQKELRHKWAENAGLIVDENGTITGINFSEEHSVSPEFAQSIFRDDTRNKDCGAIMVGASVNHAIYSAAVNWIRMVIPFHLSGMPLAAREKTDVLWYTDNTEYQSTRKKTKEGWSKIEASKDTFNLYEGMDQPGWNMRQRAKDYLAWCAENGYRPKFDWGINSEYYRAYCKEAGYTPNQQIIDIMDADTTDGVWNQYYKFLTDFTAYKPVFNEQGEMIDEISSPQLAVESNFDFSEMEKEVLFEGENSMLGHREENIKRTENYIEEIADRVVPFLNGEISEEEMNLREDVHYENRADAELYLNAQKKSEGPIDLVEEAKKAQANDLMFRFIGEKAVQRLDAMVNATTMMDNLQIARDMEAQLNPDWSAKRNPAAMKIKMATGWERGVDGMWRKEMEDFEYRPMPKRVKKTYKLSGLIKDSSLFVEYPELKDIEVKFKKLPRNTNGQLIPVGNSFRIELSEDLYQKMNPDYIAAVDNFTNEAPDRMSRILNHTASPEEISDFLNAVGSIPPRLNEFGGRDTLAHEIQHAIQYIEGFAIGGNVNMVDARDSQVAPFFTRLGQEMEEAQKLLDEYNDLQGQLVAARIVRDNVQIRYLTSSLTMVATQYKVHYQNIQTIQKLLRNFAPLGESGYHRLSGEVEARNVAERLDMSPEERRESLIADTQDVAHEDQIILRNYLMTDYAADTLVPGHVKGQPMLSDVEMLSDVSFRISNNTRRTIEGWCDKAGLAEDIKEGFIDHLEYTFDDTTEQLCAAKWYLNGTINLPNEDEYKVVGAVKVAKQNKVNPLLYYSPMDIFEKFGAPKEKLNPINPDKVSTLKNKTEVPGTDITIYDVEESEESRKNMREIINTHYGKNASPWCLLQGDAYGNLSEKSAEYWEMYSAYPKQVAFKNGRLLAFSANSSRVRTWWDRMDKSYGGVPVAEKLNDAKNRRCSVEIDPKTGKEIKRSNIYSLVEKDGYTIKRNWNEVDGPMISAQKLKDDQVVAQFNRFTRDDFANDIQYFFYGRPKGIDMVFTLEKSMMFYENGELESYSVEGFRAAYARNSRKAWTITTKESTIREFSFNRQGRLIEYFDGQRLIKDRKTLAQVEVPSEYMDIVRRDPRSFMAEAEQLLVETGLAEAYEESQEDIRFRVLDTTNAELKDKPIKMNGAHRFKLKSAFKGIKDSSGQFGYVTTQIRVGNETMEDPYRVRFDGSLEGYAVIYIRPDLAKITEDEEKEHTFYLDPMPIKDALWEALKAAENYYEAKYANGPWAKVKNPGPFGYSDWQNADKDSESSIRFRVTSEQDKAYMDAVKAGDMETAQKMVIEAAKIAMPNTKVVDEDGNPKVVYHGTSKDFTVFEKSTGRRFVMGEPYDVTSEGYFFAPTEKEAEKYGKRIVPAYVNIENPLDLTTTDAATLYESITGYKFYPEMGGIDTLWDMMDEEGIAEKIRSAGYDGVIFAESLNNEGEVNETSFAAIFPSQIKSADPVTYDDAGNVIPLSQRFNPENEDIRFRVRTEEEREKLFADAKEKYGVTDNFNAAGYMLPDGSLLDFSEANDGGDPNSRSLDHRDIEGVIMDNGVEYDSRWMYIADFMNEGAIRLLPESAGINMIQAPTEEQRKKIFDFIYKYNGEVILEINDERLNSIAYMEYDRRTSPSRIFRDIDGYFNDGIVPQQDVRFRMSNNNQAIFVSNAARAVEGIKQEKATPEQWLKMLEKAGGLKAGEDKWMGLSDWLKASDKKTLTKQEVLDYINENMIIIEEQHYSNQLAYENNSRLMDEKYPGWRDAFSFEWDDYRDAPSASILDESEAVALYNAHNEDQVEVDDDGEIVGEEDRNKVILWGEDIAKIFFGQEEGAVRPIHDTREVYTTKGLVNNHEIALTVPTIESWGKSDMIHFGDAGDGRAVAWIRFGETSYKTVSEDSAVYNESIDALYAYWDYLREKYGNGWADAMTEAEKAEEKRIRDKYKIKRANLRKKVLVIDEIQSNRHQEGREKGYKKSKAEIEQYLSDNGYEVKEDGNFYNFYKNGELERRIAKGLMHNSMDKAKRFYVAALNKDESYNSGIPDAPFDKNWHELAMKRMLRYAAENGYDVIAWTTGDQQNQRYGLSKVVDEIYVASDFASTKSEESSFRMILKNGNDNHVGVNKKTGIITFYNENPQAIGKPLSDLLGKELAGKILAARDYQTFSGVDFELSEGMKGFYDKMLPAFMNKYGKRWGVKVEDIELPNLEGGLIMHSIPVTEEMKASVMEGQVMFRTTAITPEVQDEMNAIHASAIVMGNFMKAPNGKDTNLTEEQWLMVRTKGFKTWFGDWENDPENASKVVDENGEPKVVYHGTGNEFYTFRDTSDSNELGAGYYFSDSYEMAERYATDETLADNRFRAEAMAFDIFTDEMGHSEADYDDVEFTDDYNESYYRAIERLFGNGHVKSVFLNIKNPRILSRNSPDYDPYLQYGFNHYNEGQMAKRFNDGVIDEMFEERHSGLTGIQYVAFNPSQIKSATDNTGEFSEGEGDIRFKVVTDPAKIEELENGPKIKVYRAMQLIDGKLYPPMSAKVDGQLRQPIELGQWEEAEERPDLADDKGYFKLDKANKKSLKARYNPYFHTSYTPLNDQFSEAQDRPNLVTVEVEIPASELTSGYKADKAKDSVGEKEWKAGVIQGKLSGTRKVILSRWDKPVRIVPDSEVADVIVKMLEGRDIVMPSNVVTPSLRAELEKRGVPFAETDNKGKPISEFGPIYEQFRGKPKEAVEFLMEKKTGEAVGALNHKDIGDISMVYGNEKAGLKKIAVKHPEVLDILQDILDDATIVQQSENRIKLESDRYFAVISKDYLGKPRSPWLLTSFEKKNSVPDNTMDTGETSKGSKQNDTATLQDTVSESKDSDNIDTSNELDENTSFRVTGTPTEDVVAEGVSPSPAQLASLAGDIFAALPEDSRKKITDGLNGNILGLQEAILQIPTSLATKENWNDEDRQMAEVVAEQMTKAVGIEMTRPFSASEALWTLYNAVNKSTDLVSEASRALVRRNLGFDSQTLEMEKDARDGVRFRTVGDASANAQASMYNRGAASARIRLKESFVDMNASVEELVKAIEKRSGKVAEGFENILMALNQQSSKGLAAMEAYEQKFLNKMFDEIRKIMDKTDFKYEDIVRYVILKHGLERNVKMAQRDAKAHYQEIYDDIISKIKGMNPAQKRTYLTNAQLRDADAKAELARLQAVNTSALTPDQLREHKKELAKAKKEATEAAEHLVRAQKIATMTEQDAQDELDKIFKKIEKGTDSIYKEMRKNDYSGISSMFYDTLGVNRKDYETEEEYQSALMQAKADKYDNLGDIEGAAQTEVTLFENAVNTDNLWKSINKATKETLRQQYDANMISKDQYLNLRDMFEYYVPLRGFADNTAEDMYTYYRRPNSTGYTKPILGAEGRKTEAESPFGWIAAMAGSAIASNVKNEAKLALYYFVANRPDNGIATLSKTWFVHTPGDVDANGKKIFRPAYPPFSEDLSSASAKADYEVWQANMKNLQAQGLAYEAGQRLNLGNSVVNISDTNKPEHIVNVKVGGKDYTIVINGNPRAAQAINGDLNIESSAQDYGTVFGPMLRWMSSVNTSYNPEFWITNMMRDMAFTMMAVNIKEDPAYRRKFFKNYAKAFKVISMVAKNEKGTLGNKYIENMYKDFVKYGGVTGYTQIKDSETWEKEIENYLTSNDPASIRNGKAMRGVKSVFHAAHRFGESLEQVSRFAAFLTAVETGKSINEAINDAKEITVNFNRKGSGKMITLEEAKYLTDKNGQPLNKLEQWAVVGISSIAPLGRRMIMFFNAAIQGLNATYQLWKKNKLRSIGWISGYVAVGALNAVLHAMLDDDDDYLDIPQYERRNSLMIGGNGAYFKWALPQEARAFYALGDLAVESVMGRNPHQSVIGEALKISTEILPINPSEGWKAFMPSVAIPFVELALNEDYKGAPIYNEQKWLTEEERKRSTKWSKAYSGTGDLYIGIAKVLNAVTGGDEHDAGLINLQPEKMEHLVQSAFGGTIRTADKFINTIMAAFDPEEDVTVRQFPFLNRILTINDERYKNVHVNDVYDYYAAEAEHALTLKKKYEKDKDKDSYNKLLKSDEYKWATIYSRYKKSIKQYQEKIKAAEGTKERMELTKQQDELKRKMIKEISDL